MRTAEHKLNAVQRLKAYREAVTHPAGGSIVLPVLWLPGPATLAVWVAAGALRESTLTPPEFPEALDSPGRFTCAGLRGTRQCSLCDRAARVISGLSICVGCLRSRRGVRGGWVA